MKIKIGLLCLCIFLLAGCDPAPNYNKTPNTSAAEEITTHAIKESTTVAIEETTSFIVESEPLTILDKTVEVEETTAVSQFKDNEIANIINEIEKIRIYNFPKIGDPYSKVNNFYSELSYFTKYAPGYVEYYDTGFIEGMDGKVESINENFHLYCRLSKIYYDYENAVENYNAITNYILNRCAKWTNSKEGTRWICSNSSFGRIELTKNDKTYTLQIEFRIRVAPFSNDVVYFY